jgi:hypothetical protein
MKSHSYPEFSYREMANISRGPTFGDFFTHRRVDAGQHGYKTAERSFSMTENELFGLVFAKTGSINSGTEYMSAGSPLPLY